MSDKQKIIDNIEAAYNELTAAVQGLPGDKMGEPVLGEWSAKDLVAHTASWDELTAGDLARIGRGHVPCLAAFRESDVDDWNAFLMRPRRMFSLDQVMFESKHWHDQVVAALRAFPTQLLVRP